MRVERSELRSYLNAHQGLLEAVDEAVERNLDEAEAELVAALRSNSPRSKIMAAGHILRRRSRSRF
jgi:hypothetical protein